jgi:hypothetical protein
MRLVRPPHRVRNTHSSGALRRRVPVRTLPGMTNDARLEIRLPSQHRIELDRLARETGLSVAMLMRMAARRLVHDDRRTLLELIGKEAA